MRPARLLSRDTRSKCTLEGVIYYGTYQSEKHVLTHVLTPNFEPVRVRLSEGNGPSSPTWYIFVHVTGGTKSNLQRPLN